jgi:trans-2,3-dihydro-3-hydroxyanthranilate isomerase
MTGGAKILLQAPWESHFGPATAKGKATVSEHQSRIFGFVQVDVFTDRIFGGNPLAVFPDGGDLTTEEMQSIAREMNLSETTFLFPPTQPGCHAKVRIFTPGVELPFAGHPTVGTAYVLSTLGRVPDGVHDIALEEGVGPVPVTIEGELDNPDFIWMKHPQASFGPALPDRAAIAAALSLDEADLLPDKPICIGSTGLPFLYVALRDPATVDRVVLESRALLNIHGTSESTGVFFFAPDPATGTNHVYSRMLAMGVGVDEDPATGSASGPLGAYLVREGIVPEADEIRIVSQQGTKMGRQSWVHIRLTRAGDDWEIEVGGSVVPVLTGELHIS